MKKILLILESEIMQRSLLEALTNYDVRACHVGESADTIIQFQPDALVLDLFLSGTDGFTLMETCRDHLPSVILLLSVLDSDYVRKRAAQLGVDFLIRKPCTTQYIVKHLTQMLMIHRFPDYPDNETLVDHLLSQFHIHARERVLYALRHAILLCTEDPDCLLTKDIYFTVCRKYGASTDAVDQAIRRALRNAWYNRSRDAAGWELFFPGFDTCPSNGVFIATLAAYLRKKYPSRFRKGSRLS